jgi:glutamine amidotransferase
MSERVVIIDYGSGNLHSAHKAFERAAREGGSDARVVVSAKAADVASADRVVLPGVGAYADCRRGLDAVPGMVEALLDTVIRKGRPFLGICVGMQLMATRGLEYGEHAGLDWIAGEVAALAPADPALKIPHMGWNELQRTAAGARHPVLAGLSDGRHAYFVHSYAMRCAHAGDVLAEVDYGGRVTAIIGRDNLIGTQFHPEKSQAVGLALIRNFLQWRP